MKFVRLSFFLALAAVLMVSCNTDSKNQGSSQAKSGSKSVTISGKMVDGANKVVALNRVSLSGNKSLIMNTTADSRGKFSMTSKGPIIPGIYQFVMGTKGVAFVLTGEDSEINIQGNFKTFESYDFTLTGSDVTTQQIYAYYNIVNSKWPKEEVIHYMEKEQNSLVAIQTGIAFLMNTPEEYGHVRKLINKVDADLEGNPYADEFKKMVAYYDKQAEGASGSGTTVSDNPFGVNVGDPAPEIALPNPDGEIMRLSDLKGQVVLLDFWASWCMPCRRANPGVVEIYNKYKDQGFTVFSVSLDRNGQKDAWVNAIKQDRLTWAGHVSDLKFWQSEPAQRYGVRAIPATFLIDRDGVIRKLNPRNNLEESLLEIL